MSNQPSQEKLAAVIAEMRDEAFECRAEDASAGIFPDHEAADRLTGWADTLTTLLSEHGGGGEAVGYATQDGGVTWYADGPGSVSRKPAPGTVLYTTPPTPSAPVGVEAVDEVRIQDGFIVSTSIKRPLADGGYDVVPQRLTPPAAPSVSPAVEGGTPSSRWSANGEPDPHGSRYDCERAALAMGDLTDDELANAVFLHGDERPSIADMASGKALPAIAYLTAAKDRIRWLSRRLATPEQPDRVSSQHIGNLMEFASNAPRTYRDVPEPPDAFTLDEQPGSAVQGEAVATLHADGYWTWKGTPPHESNYAGWRMDVFASPPPAPAAEQGDAMAEQYRKGWEAGHATAHRIRNALATQPEARVVEAAIGMLCETMALLRYDGGLRDGDFANRIEQAVNLLKAATPNPVVACANAPVRAEQPEGKGAIGQWQFRWQKEGDDSLLLVSHPIHGGVGVWKEPTAKRTIPEAILYALSRDLLAAAPAANGLNASVIREAAELLTAVGNSGVQLPETWRWPLIDELHGIAAIAGKEGAE